MKNPVLYISLILILFSSCFYKNKEGEGKRLAELEETYGSIELNTYYDDDSNYVFQIYTYTNDCDSSLFFSDAEYLATELFEAHLQSTLEERIEETILAYDRINKVNVVFENSDYIEFGHYSFDTTICASTFSFDVDDHDQLKFREQYYVDKTKTIQ